MLCTAIIFSLYMQCKGQRSYNKNVCTCILLQSSGLVTNDINLNKSLQPNSHTRYATKFVCSQGSLEDYSFLFLKKVFFR